MYNLYKYNNTSQLGNTDLNLRSVVSFGFQYCLNQFGLQGADLTFICLPSFTNTDSESAVEIK